MNKPIISILVLLLGFAAAMAQSPTDSIQLQPKYLHISTNPSYADAYINNTKPNHASEPDYKLPGFIEVPAGESSIQVTLFRPEFADTSINVQLSQKDTSFLIVALRPHYDETKTEKQYGEIAHRDRRKLGHKLLLTSLAPFLMSGISAIVSWYNIEQANRKKDDIKKTLIKDDEYQKSLDQFLDYRESAQNARYLAQFGLVLGGIIFTTGVVFSF